VWNEGEGNREWYMFKDFKAGGLSSLDVLSRHFSVDTEEEH
jgi:hypothetical protein